MDELDRALAELLQEFPEERRALHNELGDILKEGVDGAISQSVNDEHGRVRRWQVKHVGSGGGYAAIRPAGSAEGGGTGTESAGAITNYLEEGHKIRPPAGGRGYRPRIRVVSVSGRHFYQSAGTSIEAKAIRLAEAFTDKLGKKLEGSQ